MPQNLLCKLQNNAASLISHSAKSDHIISDPLCSTLASCQIPYSLQNYSSYLYSTEQPTPFLSLWFLPALCSVSPTPFVCWYSTPLSSIQQPQVLWSMHLLLSFLLWTLNAFPVCMQLCAIGCCFFVFVLCACVCGMCVDEKDAEWCVVLVVCLCN